MTFREFARGVVRATTVALLCAWATSLPAQEPGANLRISVITVGPGALVWERFGHNAIMVEDTVTGDALWYNYGMFDFGAKDFWPRFVKGDMRYWTAAREARLELDMYLRANRTVWRQELDLSPAERLEVKRFLEWNVLPANRYYHYDYYRDNCSTRVRDVIDRVIGGRIEALTDTVPAGTTFRRETRRLTRSSLLWYTGIELGLGRPADRPISRYEEMFLPLALHRYLTDITRENPDGSTRPLVKAEETLYLSTAGPPPAGPPGWWPWFLIAGLGLGGVLLGSGRALDRSGGARLTFGLLGCVWGLIAGVGGLGLAGLWAFTHHVASYANENLLQLSPLALPLAALVWLVVRRPDQPHRITARLALAVALCSVAGLLVKLLPGTSQVNWEIIAFALPVNAGLALGLFAPRKRMPHPEGA